MATYYIPAYAGIIVPDDMPFEVRVMYYARWIRENPVTSLHFKFPGLGPNAGFISERSFP